ncbi:PTS system beta-glucoside-specific transporter subunits IIABC [Leclercia adecarboxylata]|uniref:PTS system beta-glucoside-specific transporter subunits IIABC n=1 Tax=Leclercia adecarboxylata TaxID=83655 RepID=A0A4U9IPC6_9ENTR|nr:PTS system beta-glucoside-specific transporter subunits IIABC [Leclercia adecarboxylata]
MSAAKIFKTNEYLAAAVAACLMYPSLIEAAKALATHQEGAVSALWLMNAIPVSVFNYASSVIPGDLLSAGIELYPSLGRQHHAGCSENGVHAHAYPSL